MPLQDAMKDTSMVLYFLMHEECSKKVMRCHVMSCQEKAQPTPLHSTPPQRHCWIAASWKQAAIGPTHSISGELPLGVNSGVDSTAKHHMLV
ncbi:uncharacterized protein RAG0_15620 [Rhynchosporium agropyri]|uniref:Uncharacterized protein n=1 Tax=Rhynchosporium agropyri TaxID=914238 RepID=A0A1E1LLY7_9HELO|nr:uncharacterized protein RAG0_15620 [Rhynchosporium agropyri]